MFWLKGCPRCKGDLYEDTDKCGRYVSCLQCGYHRSKTRTLLLSSCPWSGNRDVVVCPSTRAFAMKVLHKPSGHLPQELALQHPLSANIYPSANSRLNG